MEPTFLARSRFCFVSRKKITSDDDRSFVDCFKSVVALDVDEAVVVVVDGADIVDAIVDVVVALPFVADVAAVVLLDVMAINVVVADAVLVFYVAVDFYLVVDGADLASVAVVAAAVDFDVVVYVASIVAHVVVVDAYVVVVRFMVLFYVTATTASISQDKIIVFNSFNNNPFFGINSFVPTRLRTLDLVGHCQASQN